ncbi:MAG: hypothetical protein WAM67_17310 [Candidatus Acidiferrales bacterium]
MHRIRSDFGTQFDVPESEFTIRAGARDMPAGILYTVTLKDGGARLLIWRDDNMFSELKNVFPVFSQHVEEKDVRTPGGRSIGRDRWGFLKGGDRWRYVTLADGDAVGYRPNSSKEARLFDQIIGSACISPEVAGGGGGCDNERTFAGYGALRA